MLRKTLPETPNGNQGDWAMTETYTTYIYLYVYIYFSVAHDPSRLTLRRAMAVHVRRCSSKKTTDE